MNIYIYTVYIYIHIHIVIILSSTIKRGKNGKKDSGTLLGSWCRHVAARRALGSMWHAAMHHSEEQHHKTPVENDTTWCKPGWKCREIGVF